MNHSRRPEGLSETQAPPPVETSSSQTSSSNHTSDSARARRHYHGHDRRYDESSRYLEDAERAPDEPDTALTDVLAPAPVGKQERDAYLEDVAGRGRGTDISDFTPWATQLYTISYLIVFAIFGVLARLGTQWLTFYPGAPVTIDNLWANFGGSVVMGFLTEDRKLFREEWGVDEVQLHRRAQQSGGDARGTPAMRAEHGKIKKTIPLFVGLATGFCGSFTSFSSFVRDVFNELANESPAPPYHELSNPHGVPTGVDVPRAGGYSFEALLAIVILTVTVSIGGLFLGAHIAIVLDPLTPVLPFRLVRRFLDPLFVFLAIGCWIGAVMLAIFPPQDRWRADALYAIVFAPVGCLLRWYASKKLNALIPSFPLGTFAVNMFGTVVLALCYSLQRVPLGSVPGVIGGGTVPCQVLQGVMDGFCGALTTVSTWVVELTTLKTKHAYLYGGTSVLAGLAFAVTIMGSVKWSIGFSSPACA